MNISEQFLSSTQVIELQARIQDLERQLAEARDKLKVAQYGYDSNTQLAAEGNIVILRQEKELKEAREEVERLRGEQREWQELADTAVDVHDIWKTRFIEMREIAIQLRDITRTVAANRYGSSVFADEARIRSERADVILGEKGA